MALTEKDIAEYISRKVWLRREYVNKVDWNAVSQVIKKSIDTININTYNITGNNYPFNFSNDTWLEITGIIKSSLQRNNISTDSLNELYLTLKCHAEAKRFCMRKINQKRTKIEHCENDKITIFKDYNDKIILEVTLFDNQETSISFFDEDEKIAYKIRRNTNGAISHTEAFNNEGKLLSWQNEDGILHRDDNSKIGIKIDYHSNSDNPFCSCTLIEYCKNNEKIAKETFVDNIGKSYTIYFKDYVYDKSDNLIQTYKYSNFGLEQIANFDSKGNKIKSTFYDNGKIYDSIFDYDISNRKIKSTCYIANNLRYYTNYEYNEIGNLVKEKCYSCDNRLLNQITYAYDNNDKLIQKIDSGYRNSGDIIIKYEYNNGILIKQKSTDDNGSYTKEWMRDEYGIWLWLEVNE